MAIVVILGGIDIADDGGLIGRGEIDVVWIEGHGGRDFGQRQLIQDI